MARLAFLDVSKNRLTQKGVDALWAMRGSYRTILDTAGNFVSDSELWDTATHDGTPPPHDLRDEVGRVLRRLSPSVTLP